MSIVDDAISFAVAQVGKPYVWGATGPNAYDCSGLIYAAYRHAGFNEITRTTYTQIAQGTPLDPRMPVKDRPPGALIFPESGHVYMAIGGGQIVEAATTGIPVHVRNDYTPTAMAIRQLVPAGQSRGGGGGGGAVAAPAGLSVPNPAAAIWDNVAHAVDVLGNWLFYLSLVVAGGLVAVGGAYLVVGRQLTAVRRAVPGL